ncbi:MAG: YkgJ family cysteine cluster protein [Candidatus Altiarchaeota archaeon]
MRDGWLRRRFQWYLRRRDVLETHSRREGNCVRCGGCCLGCPFYVKKDSSCRIYKRRPDICRMFPLSPKDIKNIPSCGFSFRE